MGLALVMCDPWWVGNPFIHHQWIPSQMWGHFLPGKRYSPALSKHQTGNLRDGHKLPQPKTAKPDLWDPATSFWAHPGMPEMWQFSGTLDEFSGLTTVVVEALSNRFSIPTSKEYIYKKCDKYLLAEIMPMNNVASYIRLTSNEPQQKGIQCNTVPTDKFLTFDKTKYGQNTIVSQMKENGEQNIICNKCHNAMCRESLVTCLTCRKTMKKCTHLNLIWTNTPHCKTTYEKWQNHREPTLTYARTAMSNCNKKLHVYIVTDICRNMYVKCTTK